MSLSQKISCRSIPTDSLYYMCIHLRLHKVSVTRKLSMKWRRNSHRLTSLAKAQKVLEAHVCKPWVLTNLSIVPHLL